MDGRQDQIVLVLVRRAGGVAGGRGRVEGQLGQEASRRGSGGQPLQLVEVGARARGRSRRAPRAAGRRTRRTSPSCAGQGAAPELRHHADQPRPVLGRGARRRARRPAPAAVRRVVQALERLAGDARADAGQELQHPERGHLVARVLRPAQHRQHVLDVRGLEEAQAAELDVGDVAAAPARARGRRCGWRCGTAPPGRAGPCPASRLASTSRRDVLGLGEVVATMTSAAAAPSAGSRTAPCGSPRARARSRRWRRPGSAGSSGSSARASRPRPAARSASGSPGCCARWRRGRRRSPARRRRPR